MSVMTRTLSAALECFTSSAWKTFVSSIVSTQKQSVRPAVAHARPPRSAGRSSATHSDASRRLSKNFVGVMLPNPVMKLTGASATSATNWASEAHAIISTTLTFAFANACSWYTEAAAAGICAAAKSTAHRRCVVWPSDDPAAGAISIAIPPKMISAAQYCAGENRAPTHAMASPMVNGITVCASMACITPATCGLEKILMRKYGSDRAI